MCLIALKVVPARCILEYWISLGRTQALHILLRVEASVRAWTRHLRALDLVLDVVEARLGGVEARFSHVVRQQHVVASVLTLSRAIVAGLILVEETQGG